MKITVAGIIFLYGMNMSGIIIIGHRGAAGYAPENTLSSFARAIECKVDIIEFDVWKCASGELIVFHDEKVDKLTDGHGYVSSKTLNELKQLTVLGCETIPTLQEVFDFVNRRVKLFIELKDSDIAHDVLGLINYYVKHKQWQYDDFIIGSFDHIQLKIVKTTNNLIPIIALIYGIPVQFAACVEDINPQIVGLGLDFINQAFVDDIHARGMLVYVYTVNDKDKLGRLIGYGVDGLITNYPDDIKGFLYF